MRWSGLEHSDNLMWKEAARPEHAEPLAPRAEETNQMIGSRAVWSAATRSIDPDFSSRYNVFNL